MFSPKHRSRFQRCPVCDKDVHRVLLSSHVEVCLEKGSAGGGSGVSLVPGSAGRSDDDKRASDSWGQTKEKESTRAECSGRHFGEDTRERSWETNQNHHPNNKASFSTAGAFAKHLGISPAINKENDDADGRGVFVKAGARNSKGGTRKSGGPLSGWAVATGGAGVVYPPVHSSLDELIPCSAKRSGSDDLVSPGCKKAAARGDDGMTKARGTDDTDPEKDNEDTEEHAEDVEKDDESEDNKNTDPDVDARREESALAVGDGGMFHFPVRCVFAFPKSARLFANTRLTLLFYNRRVMSGDHRDCGICLTRFDDTQGVTRHVLWPCQHARQCGTCAIRIWQVPKQKRRCPWCKSKIDIRPRPFKPFL